MEHRPGRRRKRQDDFFPTLLLLVAVVILGVLIWPSENSSTEDITPDSTPPTREPNAPVDEPDQPPQCLAQQQEFFATLSAKLQYETDRVQGRVGISFLCLTTGEQISINGDDLFFGASLAKLPRLMRIAELVEAGAFTWDHAIEYRSENIFFAGGTGILRGNIQNGDTRTVGELTRLAAVYSDNIAYWMLSNYTVALENRIQDVFDRYLPEEITGGENRFSPNHMAAILNILYNGLDQIEAYRVIYQHYLNSSFRYRLYTAQTSGYVAHVIGSNGAYIHDAGIFSGANPYILTVMTYGVYTAELYISHVSNMVWETMKN